MGIFGSRKETFVSSVVYNMAGDEFKRPNYLKTTVLSSVLNNRPSISDSIVGSYLQGPGMRFRSFAKWARNTNYEDVMGVVTATILTGDSLDEALLLPELPVTFGTTADLHTARIGEADYTYWADQYISENMPELISSEYTTNFTEQTNTITILWEDLTTTTFNPVGYDPFSRYLYAVYVEVLPDEVGPTFIGDVVLLDPEEDFPSVLGWTEVSIVVDGDDAHEVWERDTYMGQAPGRNATYTQKEIMYLDTVDEVRSYRIDVVNTYHSERGPLKVFIYKQGDGNPVLDPMFSPDESMGQFFPFIPFRVDNKFLSDTFLPEAYALAKKGYKRATTSSYDKLVEKLEDNENLADIDYGYVVFGVSLNVLENACRKYVYRFFQEILNDYAPGGGYDSWQVAWNLANASQDVWMTWRAAQDVPGSPLFNTPEPSKLPYPAVPTRSIKINSGTNSVMNYDMTIEWLNMRETAGTGLLKPDAKTDDVWMGMAATQEFEENYWSEVDGEWRRVPGGVVGANEFVISWQVTQNTWRRIHIIGLKHINLIYGGKSVEISAKEALEDPEESGFIIPLHEGIYRTMGMVDYTQMSTACSFMVFNCYQVVKKKWYQTGIFQVILIIIVVVITIYTAGAGAGAAGGLLGTNAAVGAAITGLAATSMVAIIVGAVANAIAAMLLTRMITAGATAIFGDKWGAIIGAIASVIALQVGTSMASGQSFSESFSGLMRAENIMKLMNAAGDGYQGYIAAANAELAQESQEVMDNYESESRKIRDAWNKNMGGSRGIIDPLEITSAFGVTMESVNSFLQRTLMTGSDVAEMSLDMLTNFVDMTLNTDLPT